MKNEFFLAMKHSSNIKRTAQNDCPYITVYALILLLAGWSPPEPVSSSD